MVAVTLAGTLSSIGRTAIEIGTRSVRLSPLVSTSAPNTHWFSTAVVRVTRTVTGCVCPDRMVKNCPEGTVAVTPAGASTDTVQRVEVGSTLRKSRVVWSTPASRPNAIDARLRSLGRTVGRVPSTSVGSTPSR